MKNCVFCNKNLDKGQTIHETANFYIKIGLGITAPGHIMLVPKKHYACLAIMDPELFPEFNFLKNSLYQKITETFSTPFMVEYGVLEQSVPHAHLHFIPKERKATANYPAYKITDLFKEIGLPQRFISNQFSWDKAMQLYRDYGGYIYLEDKSICLFSQLPNDFSSKKLSYRHFFNDIYKLSDIPRSWKSITPQDEITDTIKKEITQKLLKI